MHSSASNSAAERAIRSVADGLRVLKISIECAYGKFFEADHVIGAWALRHAAFLDGRFQQKASGQTAFQIAYGHRYGGVLVPFG